MNKLKLIGVSVATVAVIGFVNSASAKHTFKSVAISINEPGIDPNKIGCFIVSTVERNNGKLVRATAAERCAYLGL